MKNKLQNQQGQLLITLLFFMVASIIITTAAVAVIMTNNLSANVFQQGNTTYSIAENGIENALLNILRNPNYSGETLTLATDTAIVTVTNQNQTYTITSQGTSGNFIRTIEVIATFNNNILRVISWKEL